MFSPRLCSRSYIARQAFAMSPDWLESLGNQLHDPDVALPAHSACSITHVKAVGTALPCFRCRPAAKGGRVLEYCADAPVPPLSDAHIHVNGFDAALFVAEFDSDEEEPEEGIWD